MTILKDRISYITITFGNYYNDKLGMLKYAKSDVGVASKGAVVSRGEPW